VIYAKAFFDLQLAFARIVSALSRMALALALLEYTNFYVRFGLGRDFDARHPTWQEYLAGLRDASDHGEWTYRFYMTRARAVAPPGIGATFGCFSYARLSADRLRLHFHNAEIAGRSPLGKERQHQRLAELAALFEHVKRTERQALRVVGASWLYNLDAYRRLFPESYLATARVTRGRFQHLPLWGQFVGRYGEVKDGMAQQLLERLARLSSMENLDQCFPFQVLGLEAPVLDFFEHHGV
jgi:hypothetical protein